MADRISQLPIKIEFDLPYSLRLDVLCRVRTNIREYQIRLSTIYNENPQMPGADHVENIEYVHDNTNIFAYTHVQAEYAMADVDIQADHRQVIDAVNTVALDVSNAIISAARSSFKEFHYYSLFSADQLNNIGIEVHPGDGHRPWSGMVDNFGGGFTMRRPARDTGAVGVFCRTVDSGEELPISDQLFFDANAYMLANNNLMAAANLAISFETLLARELSRVATHRSDTGLQNDIDSASINELGTKIGKAIFGASMENATSWGPDFVSAYRWLRTIRNKVLHKAETVVTLDGQTKDFSQKSDLKWLFEKRSIVANEVSRRVEALII